MHILILKCTFGENPKRVYNSTCAALAVKAGMNKEKALKTIAINVAEILNAQDRVGSIELGKDADIIIWSVHPLELESKVMYTIIDG